MLIYLIVRHFLDVGKQGWMSSLPWEEIILNPWDVAAAANTIMIINFFFVDVYTFAKIQYVMCGKCKIKMKKSTYTISQL